MGQSTEELSEQIAGTRENLAQDLDALGNRVSPTAMLERRKQAARGRFQHAKSRVMGTAGGVQQSMSESADSVAGTARDVVDAAEERYEGSPLAAGLVAFGAGMVISALIPPSEAETRAARQVVDVAREQGQPALEEMKGSAQEIAGALKESATEATRQVTDVAAESASHVKEEGMTSAENVKSETQGSAGPSRGSTL